MAVGAIDFSDIDRIKKYRAPGDTVRAKMRLKFMIKMKLTRTVKCTPFIFA